MAWRLTITKSLPEPMLECVNWTLGNKRQGNLARNLYIFVQENAFEIVAWKMAAFLSRPKCVKVNCLLRAMWHNINTQVCFISELSELLACIYLCIYIYMYIYISVSSAAQKIANSLEVYQSFLYNYVLFKIRRIHYIKYVSSVCQLWVPQDSMTFYWSHEVDKIMVSCSFPFPCFGQC